MQDFVPELVVWRFGISVCQVGIVISLHLFHQSDRKPSYRSRTVKRPALRSP